MNIDTIVLISFGYFGKGLPEKVVDEVSNQFFRPVSIKEGHLDLSNFYYPPRNQYDANKLLKEIDIMYGGDNRKTLGIFNVDLFIPILTYIFGQAYLNGRTGIASMYRLSNERYGIKRDDEILISRFRKEIIHELGHCFGLIHCQNPTCVMRSSTYVEDIDQKDYQLCSKCHAEIMKR